MTEEERKMIGLLARILYKINFGDKLNIDEERALSNIICELDAWDINAKDFHY